MKIFISPPEGPLMAQPGEARVQVTKSEDDVADLEDPPNLGRLNMVATQPKLSSPRRTPTLKPASAQVDAGGRDRILRHDCSTHFDRASDVTLVRVEALVRRELDNDLALVIDPRNWSATCPTFFVNSYRVAERGGVPLVCDGVPKPSENAPDLGTTWSGYLYEDVQVSSPLLSWRIRNILRIAFRSSRNPRHSVIRMDFGLHECLWSKLGASAINGGVDVDCGYIEILREPQLPGVLHVTATKSLRFTSRSDLGAVGGPIAAAMNYLAPQLLSNWMDGLLLGAMSAPVKIE